MAIGTSLPPGPKGHFLTGSIAEFHKDILGFYTMLARDYGECARFRMGTRTLVLLSNPDWIERVLVTDSKNFAKMTYVLSLIVPVLGNGLLTSDGEFWLRQRRLIQPAFSRQRLAGYSECMIAFAERMVNEWQDGATLDVHQQMMQLALEIVAKVLFDADVADDTPDVGEALLAVMYNFLNRWGSFLPLPSWFPTQSNLRLYRSIRRLDKIIYRFIAERRVSDEQRNDLLSILLHARDEDDGRRMTDRQLRDEAMTLFLAGHETTALVLAFAWYLLGQNPGVEEKLLDELKTVLAGRLPTHEDVPNLKYTEAVIHETMRLYPPAYGFGRVARKDCEFGGYHVAAGTTIIVSQWVMHHDPRYWDDPDTFRPERWLDGSTKNLPKFAYFPFGGGPRRCIGDSFAMIESTLVLATMLPKVHLDVVLDHPIVLRPAVVMRPEFGIKVKVRRR